MMEFWRKAVQASTITGLTPLQMVYGSPSGGIAQTPLWQVIAATDTILTATPNGNVFFWEQQTSLGPGGSPPAIFFVPQQGGASDGVVPAGNAGGFLGLGNTGGNGSGAFDGGLGSLFQFFGGNGGDGTALAPSGAGGDVKLIGGNAGNDNGGGLGNPGVCQLDSGVGGLVELGAANSALVSIGAPAGATQTNSTHLFVKEATSVLPDIKVSQAAAPAVPAVGSVKTYFRQVLGKPVPFFLENDGTEHRFDYDQQSGLTRILANTTTGSLIFVPLMSASLTTKDGFMLAFFAASVSNTSINTLVFFRLVLNGVPGPGQAVRCTTASQPFCIAINTRVAVAAGINTMEVQWRVSGGVGQIRPVAAPDNEGAQLLVQEVKL